MSEIQTIDGNLLYQAIDPLTKSIAPEFYKQFESVGQESLDLFIELKIVLTSNISRREENIIKFFRKLDGQLTNLPTPIQNWFKKFYKIRISPEIKGKILAEGQLKSLDKIYRAKLQLVDPLQWYNGSTVPPYDALNQKIPCNMANINKNANSAAIANFAAKQKRLQFCKDRAKGPAIRKITTPDKSHGDVGLPVGDYEFPKRMGKIVTEYTAKIMDFLGDNAKSFMDNFNYKPSSNNVQTGAPNVSIPTKVGGKTVNTTIYGNTVKKPESKNPFIPCFLEDAKKTPSSTKPEPSDTKTIAVERRTYWGKGEGATPEGAAKKSNSGSGLVGDYSLAVDNSSILIGSKISFSDDKKEREAVDVATPAKGLKGSGSYPIVGIYFDDREKASEYEKKYPEKYVNAIVKIPLSNKENVDKIKGSIKETEKRKTYLQKDAPKEAIANNFSK
jgi:hypothetical protein